MAVPMRSRPASEITKSGWSTGPEPGHREGIRRRVVVGGLAWSDCGCGNPPVRRREVSPVTLVGWGGGEVPVRAAAQPPAPLMDRPMMGPTHQHQVL